MSRMSIPYVAVIDYGMGNLFSVRQACEYVGLNAVITCKKEEILDADAAILPGVGAFGDAMANLKELALIGPILNFIRSGKPFMGICLGMQLLFSEGLEFGRHRGLDVIKGSVVRFSNASDQQAINKVPQVGWNSIKRPSFASESSWEKTPLSKIKEGEFMYFVHSYYAIPEKDEVILSVTQYASLEYCSSLMRQNLFACQFHPEKSAGEGLKIYQQFSSMIKN